MKSITPSQKDVIEKWYHVDATGLRLGKLAGFVAELLMGKTDPAMRNYLMPKYKVVITNAAKLDVTERKALGKTYTSYSGFPGGIRIDSLAEMMAKKPNLVIEKAIKGMLPRNKRSDAIMSNNLFVYADATHKHEAQQPETVTVK